MSVEENHQANEQNNVKCVINFFNLPQPNANNSNAHIMDPRSPTPSLISENSIECSLSGHNMVVSDAASICSEESEQELTNLTWLTELRNQSLAWPDSIQPIIDDDTTEKKCPPKGSIKILNKSQENTTTIQHKRPTPSERYKTFLDKVYKDIAQYDLSAKVYQTNANEKPPFNYSHIIGMAMIENGRMTLQQICSWIESKFAFFRVRKKWNNSIRHNLSLHHCFRKIDRSKYEKGKGGYWELGIDPKKCDRKRIRNRKSSKSRSFGTAKEKLHTNDATMSDDNGMRNCIEVETNEEIVLDEIQDVIEMPQEYKNKRTILSDFELSTNAKHLESNHHHLRQYDINDSIQLRDVFIANGNNCENGSASSNISVGDGSQMETVLVDALPTNISVSHVSQANEIQHQMNVFVEDEIPQPCENVIVSSYLNYENRENQGQPNVIVEQLDASYAALTTETHFRPYIDGIDEAFHYLRSVDNRCDDLFDNLLDISVSDY